MQHYIREAIFFSCGHSWNCWKKGQERKGNKLANNGRYHQISNVLQITEKGFQEKKLRHFTLIFLLKFSSLEILSCWIYSYIFNYSTTLIMIHIYHHFTLHLVLLRCFWNFPCNYTLLYFFKTFSLYSSIQVRKISIN